MTRAAAGRLRLRAEDLREPVLERVVAALAARVDLPLDRLADAQLVSSALVRGATRHLVDGVLCVDLDIEDGAIGLAVGPLPVGEGRQLVAETLPGVGPVLERLVDEWSVEPMGDGAEVAAPQHRRGRPRHVLTGRWRATRCRRAAAACARRTTSPSPRCGGSSRPT